MHIWKKTSFRYFFSQVLATIVEIPPPVRDFDHNVILMGLWHSSIEPSAEILLTEIVDSICVLRTNGLLLDLDKKGI